MERRCKIENGRVLLKLVDVTNPSIYTYGSYTSHFYETCSSHEDLFVGPEDAVISCGVDQHGQLEVYENTRFLLNNRASYYDGCRDENDDGGGDGHDGDGKDDNNGGDDDEEGDVDVDDSVDDDGDEDVDNDD